MRDTLAWAAGLFEGEGCITCNNGKVRMSINRYPQWVACLGMVDKDVVKRFHAVMKYGSVVQQTRLTVTGKRVWVWRCSARRDVDRVLRRLLPHLGRRRGAKARQCLRAIQPLMHRKAGGQSANSAS